jgi:AcrR family transcriptional regulator
MKISEIKTGRVKQKFQTRHQILEATQKLMQKHEKLTLEDVAKEASISRATIYRYYSTIDVLIAEASLDLKYKSPDELFEEVKDMNLPDRLFYIQKEYTRHAQRNETVFRRYLSVVLAESIGTKKKLRGARRVESLEKALAPFEDTLPKDTFKKLVGSASLLMGIDPLIVCRDICGLNNQEMEETLQWALDMILRGISHDKIENKGV